MGRILSGDKALAGRETPASNTAELLEQFDISGIIRDARNDSKTHAGRITRMLTKGPGLRIGLILMDAGTNWEEHKTESRIIVQPLEGRIRFTTHERATEIGPGELLVLAPGELHGVEALEQTAFLLTLG
jgi:quercetin dioxygenase-like cupin family protein